jgi:hypothetical protein
MGRVLKGEALPWTDAATASSVCAVLTVLALVFVARTLRSAAVKS